MDAEGTSPEGKLHTQGVGVRGRGGGEGEGLLVLQCD